MGGCAVCVPMIRPRLDVLVMVGRRNHLLLNVNKTREEERAAACSSCDGGLVALLLLITINRWIFPSPVNNRRLCCQTPYFYCLCELVCAFECVTTLCSICSSFSSAQQMWRECEPWCCRTSLFCIVTLLRLLLLQRAPSWGEVCFGVAGILLRVRYWLYTYEFSVKADSGCFFVFSWKSSLGFPPRRDGGRQQHSSHTSTWDSLHTSFKILTLPSLGWELLWLS